MTNAEDAGGNRRKELIMKPVDMGRVFDAEEMALAFIVSVIGTILIRAFLFYVCKLSWTHQMKDIPITFWTVNLTVILVNVLVTMLGW